MHAQASRSLTHTHAHISENSIELTEFVSIFQSVCICMKHQAWPWLCSFHFIFSFYRCVFIVSSLAVAVLLNRYVVGLRLLLGIDIGKKMLRLQKQTDSLFTSGVCFYFAWFLFSLFQMDTQLQLNSNDIEARANTNVSWLFQGSNEQERWLKRFPRNFGICCF